MTNAPGPPIILKNLFIATAVLEVGAGLALVCAPGSAMKLLFGAVDNVASTTATIEELCGMALLAIACTSWFAQYDSGSRAARGVVCGLVVYNLGAIFVLGAAGLGTHQVGVLLWPGVALHVVMLVWCLHGLAKSRDKAETSAQIKAD